MVDQVTKLVMSIELVRDDVMVVYSTAVND
jgi:hypothetical protein